MPAGSGWIKRKTVPYGCGAPDGGGLDQTLPDWDSVPPLGAEGWVVTSEYR